MAPVGPALTSASERPSATSAAAITIEASWRERTAATGSSALVISPVASISSTPSTAASASSSAVVAEDAQRDAVGGGGRAPVDEGLDAQLGAAPVERDGRGASGTYSSEEESARPSPISCEITSRPA